MEKEKFCSPSSDEKGNSVTEVTPPLENTRFSGFCPILFLRLPSILQDVALYMGHLHDMEGIIPAKGGSFLRQQVDAVGAKVRTWAAIWVARSRRRMRARQMMLLTETIARYKLFAVDEERHG